MNGSLINAVVLDNPPYGQADFRNAAQYAVTFDEPVFSGVSFTNALRSKLISIQEKSESVELNRQVLLALHETPNVGVFQAEDFEPKPRLFDAYGDVVSYEESHNVFVITSEFPLATVASPVSPIVHFGQILLFHFVSFLLDRFAEFWNTVARARLEWSSFAIKFRDLMTRKLRFKPFHTPLRLFPSSIHPIDSIA